jgi:hypothetical protein
MNEGSRAPDYSSGPVWAIFDQAAVDANGWKLRHPYIADPPNGTFFKADTIAELARLVVGNRFQRMPLKYLEQTVARFNGFVAAGKDTDFEKAAMHRIDKAPFHWRTENRRALPGHRHLWEADSGSFCRRRGLRRRPAAWHRPRVCPWLYGGDVRGCRTGRLT